MPQPDLDRRLQLLQHNRDAAMLMLSSILAGGLAVDDVVAIVADTRDSIGGALARAMAERDGASNSDGGRCRARAADDPQTLLACMTTRLAVAIFEASNPSVSAGIVQPVVPGRVRVVVVGGGGSTLVHVPIVAVPSAGAA
jgi:hypothetical protein